MNLPKLFLSLLVLFFFALPVFSQKQKVSGKITDAATGVPLAGTTIKVRSSGISTVAQKDGTFSVEANTADVLEISSVGYGSQFININNQSELSVQLLPLAQDLGQIVMLGSRRSGRVKTDSPVPVDVISISQATLTSARPDLTSLLNYAAPSFNYNKQSGSDGADQVDLATLRGLGPDQTLVLINGKRRHQTAFVAVFGTRGRGNSGTDLNAIPEASIDRVEILRDGASAQYGSDAIAGVINLILKKDINKLNINAGYSGYYDKKYNSYFGRKLHQYEYGSGFDGKAFSFGIDGGTSIGKNKGTIHLSANFLTQGKTYRQVIDTNLGHKDGLPINVGRRANGDGSVTGIGAMVNLEAPIANTRATFYAFGGANYKESDAFAYTRTFHGYNPLSSSRPSRFPTDANGNLIYDPYIMKIIPTPGDLADTVFNPHIQSIITDASVAMGLKGTTASSWDWDISNTFGGNNFHYYGDKTYNASLGAAGLHKNHFDDGGFYTHQNTSNLDFSKRFATVAQGFDLSLGAEYRYEEYGIYRGEEGSWANYSPGTDKASGSQGFPGFQPVDYVTATRINVGGYVDAELDITKSWLIGGAVRVENYNDFGFVNTYKFATRVKIGSDFNLRGSVSTGFRAPSLQQINFSNTFTNVQGGKTFDVKIAPNYSPITKAAGIPELKQEKSLNASLGFTWKPVSNLTFTIDGYYVNIKDRIVLSGQFDETSQALKPILEELGVAQAQFFANAVNTTNTGVDLVIDYSTKWDKNSFSALFTGNFQNMKIDKINVPAALNDSYEHQQAFFSDREQKFILASAPPVKFGLTLDYNRSCVGIGTHLTYFGKIKLLGYGYANTYPPQVQLDNSETIASEEFNYNGKLVTDLYLSFKFCKDATLYLGADNLFNVHPDLGYVKGAKLSAYDGETGGPWDAVQMGDNGTRLFAKIALTFK